MGKMVEGDGANDSNDSSSDPGEPRDDEYADQAVQTFRVSTSAPAPEQVPEEKSIVIASREAETVRVKHDDVPKLADAIKREKARQAELAAESGVIGPPSSRSGPRSAPGSGPGSAPGDMSWVDERDSFDPALIAERESSPESSPVAAAEPVAPPAPQKSRGPLIVLLLLIIAGGAGIVVYLSQKRGALSDAGASRSATMPPPASPETSASSADSAGDGVGEASERGRMLDQKE
jgi:hypothetical protein